ncbi:MAG: 4-hydroxybenzoate octaprenyltransferase [Rhizobiaceae bacterium]
MNETISNRVADAPADIWVYRLLPSSIWPYAQLARWDRPIGWWLLLWPCWWSLALSVGVRMEMSAIGEGAGSIFILLLGLLYFWLGAVMMRGAGCTYNDIVDTQIDAKVARTASRPIPSGRVTKKKAIFFMGLQALVGLFCLVSLSGLAQTTFNEFTLVLGISSLLVVAAYPFAKRVTDWPQLVLGLAFSWGALMGWAVVFGDLAWPPLLMYLGSILWVIGYDTMYAHQDKEDDALIGVRSTARLFGERTKPALIVLYAATLVLFAGAFSVAGAGWPAYLALVIGCGHMIWQVTALNIDDADNCLALFKSNSIFGWIVFAGLMADMFI